MDACYTQAYMAEVMQYLSFTLSWLASTVCNIVYTNYISCRICHISHATSALAEPELTCSNGIAVFVSFEETFMS